VISFLLKSEYRFVKNPFVKYESVMLRYTFACILTKVLCKFLGFSDVTVGKT
jgi:hypothetical protein